METSPEEDDVISLEIKSDIQLILSVLCETDMHRKVKPRPERCFNVLIAPLYHSDYRFSCYAAPQELFGSEGVEMAVHFLRKGSNKFYSGLGHNKLVLTTVDCVWSVQHVKDQMKIISGHFTAEKCRHILLDAFFFSKIKKLTKT